MARVSAYSLSSLPVLTGVLVDALTRESIEVGSKLYGGYPGVGAVLLDVGDGTDTATDYRACSPAVFL